MPGMEECIARFEKEPGVDDAGALCAWMEKEGKGYFAPGSPGDEKALAAAVAEYGRVREGRSRGAPSRFVTLREHCGQRPCRVDRDRGVIHGVKVIGTESLNGVEGMPGVRRRVYPLSVLRAAKGLYEGAKVDWNHPGPDDGPRDASDGVGVLRNVRVGTGGLYGDLHYLKSHPRAENLAEAAERMPHRYGLSPHHTVDGDRRGNAFVVKKIIEVHSVDLVHSPATTRGLFEGRNMARDLSEQDEMDLGPEAPAAEVPAEPMAEVPAEGEGFKMELSALLDDIVAGDAVALKKFNDIAKMVAKVNNTGGGTADTTSAAAEQEEEDEDEDEDKMKMGMKKEARSAPAAPSGWTALRLLSEARVVSNVVLDRALRSCTSEAEMREMIEAAKALHGRPVPTVARTGGAVSLREGKQATRDGLPDEAGALLDYLRGGE